MSGVITREARLLSADFSARHRRVEVLAAEPSGVDRRDRAHIDIGRFLVACIVGPTGRYLSLAVLLQRYGSTVRAAPERCLTLVVVGGAVLLVAGVMMI